MMSSKSSPTDISEGMWRKQHNCHPSISSNQSPWKWQKLSDMHVCAWGVYAYIHTYTYVHMYLTHSKGRLRLRGQYTELDEPVYFGWQRALFRQIM